MASKQADSEFINTQRLSEKLSDDIGLDLTEPETKQTVNNSRFELYLQMVRDRVRPAVISGLFPCSEIDYCVGVIYLAAYMTGNQPFYDDVQYLYSLSRTRHLGNIKYQEGIPSLTCLNDILKHKWKLLTPEINELYSCALVQIDKTLHGTIDSRITVDALSRVQSKSDTELIFLLQHYQVVHKIKFGEFPDSIKSAIRYVPYYTHDNKDTELLNNLYRLGEYFLSDKKIALQKENRKDSFAMPESLAKAIYGDNGNLMRQLSFINPSFPKGSRVIHLVPGFFNDLSFEKEIYSVLKQNPPRVLFICGYDKIGKLVNQLIHFPDYRPEYFLKNDDTFILSASTQFHGETLISLDGEEVKTVVSDLNELNNLDSFYQSRRLNAFVNEIKGKWESDDTWRAVKQFCKTQFEDMFFHLEERLTAYLQAFSSAGVIDSNYRPQGDEAFFMVGLISTRLYLGKLTIPAKQSIIVEKFSSASTANNNLNSLLQAGSCTGDNGLDLASGEKLEHQSSIINGMYIKEWTRLLNPSNKNWNNKIKGQKLKSSKRDDLVNIILSVETNNRELFPSDIFFPLPPTK